MNEDELKRLSEMYEREQGFTQIVQMLINAKKPLVGHNPQYDVAFLYEQFIAPLPDTFIEFCQEWRKLFPVTYDTKCIFSEFEAGTWSANVRSYLDKVFQATQDD